MGGNCIKPSPALNVIPAQAGNYPTIHTQLPEIKKYGQIV